MPSAIVMGNGAGVLVLERVSGVLSSGSFWIKVVLYKVSSPKLRDGLDLGVGAESGMESRLDVVARVSGGTRTGVARVEVEEAWRRRVRVSTCSLSLLIVNSSFFVFWRS